KKFFYFLTILLFALTQYPLLLGVNPSRRDLILSDKSYVDSLLVFQTKPFQSKSIPWSLIYKKRWFVFAFL
ncbi:MAG: hypothetical protein DRN08_04490, partial [Thermoplasmata archaeon]